MIERYTRAEMGKIWTQDHKFHNLLLVELAVAKAQAKLGMIPGDSYLNIKQKARFNVKRILEIERITRHDVIAFVSNVAESVGEDGKYIHFGLTSSDVLDSGLSLSLRDAFKTLEKSIHRLESALRKKIKKYESLVCVGRTHGIHAEPTTYGHKFQGFLQELKRNQIRLSDAKTQACLIKLSGAVGTYSLCPPEVEKIVAKDFGLPAETIATQVIPRDRLAQVMYALASHMAGIERICLEIRHLQRSEVGEVEEGFAKGQKGSSAMPHKKNPIGCENLTGLSRMVRSYVSAALENIPLWHERDISHSSVERIFVPDAFILADYASDRLAGIIDELVIRPENVKANVELTKGRIYSSRALLALVRKGLPREEAYLLIQKASQDHPRLHLKDAMRKSSKISHLMKEKEIHAIFS